jgi:cell division protein FtsW (lipid II flippase)
MIFSALAEEFGFIRFGCAYSFVSIFDLSNLSRRPTVER